MRFTLFTYTMDTVRYLWVMMERGLCEVLSQEERVSRNLGYLNVVLAASSIFINRTL